MTTPLNKSEPYRMLNKGEIVLHGDECLIDKEWEKAVHGVGREVPDPAYTAHVLYRRPLKPMPEAVKAWVLTHYNGNPEWDTITFDPDRYRLCQDCIEVIITPVGSTDKKPDLEKDKICKKCGYCNGHYPTCDDYVEVKEVTHSPDCESSVIKSCVCGQAPELVSEKHYKEMETRYQVQCKCGITGADFNSTKEAIYFWNTGKILQSNDISKEVERLKAENIILTAFNSGIEKLVNENKRLREALEKIDNHPDQDPLGICAIKQIAREALNPTNKLSVKEEK